MDKRGKEDERASYTQRAVVCHLCLGLFRCSTESLEVSACLIPASVEPAIILLCIISPSVGLPHGTTARLAYSGSSGMCAE